MLLKPDLQTLEQTLAEANCFWSWEFRLFGCYGSFSTSKGKGGKRCLKIQVSTPIYSHSGLKTILALWSDSHVPHSLTMLAPQRSPQKPHVYLEVADERHPEHIRGNGPEQDYLSRSLYQQFDSAAWKLHKNSNLADEPKDILRVSGLTLTWPTISSCIRCSMHLAGALFSKKTLVFFKQRRFVLCEKCGCFQLRH